MTQEVSQTETVEVFLTSFDLIAGTSESALTTTSTYNAASREVELVA